MRPHPITRYSRRWWLVAGVAGIIGVTMSWLGAWAGALPALPLVVLAAWAARVTHRAGRVVQVHNAAFQHTLAGHFDRARALLDTIEADAKSRYLERAVWSQRTLIALYQGDLPGCEAAAARALAKPPRFSSRLIEEQQIATTYAMRALARALQAKHEEALQDAERAEAYREAGAGVLGRVLLARLVVAAQSGDRERLRALIAESRTGRVVQELPSRERALYRSYRTLAYAPGPGAYRELASADGGPEAEFLRSAEQAAPLSLPEADPAAVERVHDARKKAARKITFRKAYLGIGMWVGLSVLLLTLWQWLSSPEVPEAQSPSLETIDDGTWSTALLTWALLLLPLGMAFWRLRTTRRRQRSIGAANHAIALGREPEARRILESLLSRRPPALAAQAGLLLAELDYASARFEEAAKLAAESLARIPDGQARAMHSDLLVPGLQEVRAASLAAAGRSQEARAELAVLLAECPSYAFRARAEHRVALLAAVSAGDMVVARSVAKARPATSLTLREEMLGDLVSMEEASSALERERVVGELGESAALARWIESVAPGLAQRVGRAPAVDLEALASEAEPEPIEALARARS